MKTKFVVKAIEDTYSGGTEVDLTLTKYRKPMPPEPEPEPEPVIDPLEHFVPETDEERVMLKMFKALKKLAPSLFSPIVSRRAVPTRCYPIVEMKLHLTEKEYDELGKPGLRQILELEIVKVKDEQTPP